MLKEMAVESYVWEILEVINWMKFTLRELILPTSRKFETILFDKIDKDENEDSDINLTFNYWIFLFLVMKRIFDFMLSKYYLKFIY